MAVVATGATLVATAPVADAVVPPPPPTMTVDPRCGDGGPSTVRLAGENLPAGRTLRVVVDGNQLGFVTSTAGGAVDAAVPLPALPDQLHVIALQQDVSFEGPAVWQNVVQRPYQVPCPAVAAIPDRLAQRPGPFQLRLRATGFHFPTDVVFRLDGAVVGSRRPDLGVAVLVLDLPAVPACGSHPVDVSQPRAPRALLSTASSALVVTCPTLQADPSSVPDSSLPAPVTVTGTGWDVKAAVTLTVDGAPGPTTTTDGDGRFSAPVQIPTRPCGGTVPVVATEVLPGAAPSSRPTASTGVAVTCSPTPTTPPPTDPPVEEEVPEAQPPVLVADPVVASGAAARAFGSGFAPNQAVTLGWLLPDGTTAPGAASVRTDAQGGFTVFVLVLPHARLGPRDLVAEPAAGVPARAAVLVVNGPMEPGGNRLLGRR
jgi:hypothetical protein